MAAAGAVNVPMLKLDPRSSSRMIDVAAPWTVNVSGLADSPLRTGVDFLNLALPGKNPM